MVTPAAGNGHLTDIPRENEEQASPKQKVSGERKAKITRKVRMG